MVGEGLSRRLPALANNVKHKTHFTVASDTIGVNLNCLMFEQPKQRQQQEQKQLKATPTDVLNLGCRWLGFGLVLAEDKDAELGCKKAV